MQTVERREIFLLFKICQARGLRLRLRVQSQGLRQFHLPFRLARYREKFTNLFPATSYPPPLAPHVAF